MYKKKKTQMWISLVGEGKIVSGLTPIIADFINKLKTGVAATQKPGQRSRY